MAWQLRHRTSHFSISARIRAMLRPRLTMLLTLSIFGVLT